MSQVFAPSALTKGVLGTLVRALTGIDRSALLGKVAMLVESDKSDQIYSWLGEAPRMRQLDADDEIIYDAPSDTSYSLVNGIWKSGIIVKRKDIDDDQIGAIMMRINQLANTASQHVNRLILNALTANGTGYDGVTFFNDAHPARGQQTATQDNLLASSGVTVALLQTDIGLALQAMLSFLAENGEPFDDMITNVTILTAPALYMAMRDAVYGQLISNTSNARFAGFNVDVVASARITTATQFFVLNTSVANDLPIIVQERDALELTANVTGDDATDREQYKYSARWRGAVGYGHWQRAVRVQ
jgi:phage major head subunit gpT-like protein